MNAPRVVPARLPAGRELDHQVVTRVMGWEPLAICYAALDVVETAR